MNTLKIDLSWNGLTRPGDASDHFGKDTLPSFAPHLEEFSLVNAFWLSEISRLIYRRNPDEKQEDSVGPSRGQILATVGLREALFLGRQDTQCALLRSAPHNRPPFAVLVFRGTTGLRNWFLDLDVRPERIAPRVVVHRGFKEALHQVWSDLLPHLEKLTEPLFMTGHSMGGALAQLAAWYHAPRAVYSFGAPRVGDAGFAARMTSFPIFRLVNDRDVVALLPPSSQLLAFKSAGRLVHIDRQNRICKMDENGAAARCWENRHLTLTTTAARWYNPPGFLVDHAPINYSAKIQKNINKDAPRKKSQEDPSQAAIPTARVRAAGPSTR